MPPRLLTAALAALLLVAGCAPGAVGSRDTPYDLRHERTVGARPASTTYVLAAFDHGAFGYRVEDLPGRWIPWGADGAAASVTALFEVRDVVAPDGWELEVDQVRGFDRPNRTGVAIEAVLRLEVPPGARHGGQRVRATLVARNGQRQPLEIIVQVGP